MDVRSGEKASLQDIAFAFAGAWVLMGVVTALATVYVPFQSVDGMYEVDVATSGGCPEYRYLNGPPSTIPPRGPSAVKGPMRCYWNIYGQLISCDEMGVTCLALNASAG